MAFVSSEDQGHGLVRRFRDASYLGIGFTELPSQDGFDWGIVKEQFYDEYVYVELSPEEKLHFVSLLQCAADWVDLFKNGTVANGHFGEKARQSDYFTMEDAITLHDFLFSDHYGDGDPNFIPLRDICKALCIDIHKFRAALKTIGTREGLLKLPLMREHQLIAMRKAKAVERRNASLRAISNRRVLVFEEVRRNGCRVCASPNARHSHDEVFVHKAVCETRECHVS